MRWYKPLLFLLPLLLCSGLYAQNTTTLTGTVTDSDSQAWVNAQWVATIVVPGGGNAQYKSGGAVPASFAGVLSSAGAFSTATVGDTSKMLPNGVLWNYCFQPVASVQPTCFQQATHGTTYAMGGFISGFLQGPRIPAALNNYAYNLTEITNPLNGTGFINTVTGACYYWQSGGYQTCGGGSGSVAFSALTGGTNSTAAMVVASGASLTPSGTGSIIASNGVNLLGAVPVENYGALGNSIGVAGNGHNDTTALQACINALTGTLSKCLLQAGKIYRTTAAINLNANNVGFVGNSAGQGPPWGNGALTSQIMIDSPSENCINVNGTWNVLENFACFRSVLPTGTATGIAFGGYPASPTTAGTIVDNVEVSDNIYGFSWLGGASYGMQIKNTNANNGQNPNLHWSPSTATTCYYLLSDATHQFASLQIDNGGCNSAFFGTNTTALSMSGPDINDVYVTNFSDANSTYGFTVNCTTSHGCYDIHFREFVLQSYNGITVTTPTNRDTQSIEFDSGWQAGNGYPFNITGAGVTIDNMQVYSSTGEVSSVTGSNRIAIRDNNFAGVTGVTVTNTLGSVFSNNVTQGIGTTSPYLFSFVNSSNNAINGNTMFAPYGAGFATGISFDNASNNNTTCGNTLGGDGSLGPLVTDYGVGNGCPTTSANNPQPLEGWLSQDGGLPLQNSGTDSGNSATGSGITFTTSAGFTHPVATYDGTHYATGTSGTNTAFTNSTPFTVSAWESQPNPSTGGVLVSNVPEPAGAPGWKIYLNGSTYFFGLINTNSTNAIFYQTSGNNIDVANTLFHICAVYDGTGLGSGLHGYVNGIAQTMNPVWNNLTSSATSSSPVVIGAEGFTGVIGNVQIFENNTTSCAVLYAQGPNFVGAGAGTAVRQVIPGAGVTVTPSSGIGTVIVNNSGVTKVIPGAGISVSPGGGTGAVTITATSATPITGQLVLSTPTVMTSNGCYPFTVTMTGAVPANHVINVSVDETTPVTGINQPPVVTSISGTSVTLDFCNAWAGPVTMSAGTWNLAVQ